MCKLLITESKGKLQEAELMLPSNTTSSAEAGTPEGCQLAASFHNALLAPVQTFCAASALAAESETDKTVSMMA
jgi:hypothetical protein